MCRVKKTGLRKLLHQLLPKEKEEVIEWPRVSKQSITLLVVFNYWRCGSTDKAFTAATVPRNKHGSLAPLGTPACETQVWKHHRSILERRRQESTFPFFPLSLSLSNVKYGELMWMSFSFSKWQIFSHGICVCQSNPRLILQAAEAGGGCEINWKGKKSHLLGHGNVLDERGNFEISMLSVEEEDWKKW